MSGVSLPVTRPVGRALLVGNAASRAEPLAALQQLGFAATESDDPYAAMAELCRRPLTYRALILSLASLYREELNLIATVKRRFPHIEIWLAQTDGRQGALADGMRFGADGLLAEDGLHRIAVPASMSQENPPILPAEAEALAADSEAAGAIDSPVVEPVLTADELRALLQDQPAGPSGAPAGEN